MHRWLESELVHNPPTEQRQKGKHGAFCKHEDINKLFKKAGDDLPNAASGPQPSKL